MIASRPGIGRRARCVATAFALLLSAIAAGSPIEFATTGGDAWTFTKRVSGTFEPGACDSISVASSTATIEALRIGTQFHADVPLIPGRNELRATCSRGSSVVATTGVQTWHTALPDLPKARIRIRADAKRIHLTSGSETAQGLAAPLTRFEWRAHSDNPNTLRIESGEILSAETATAASNLIVSVPDRDGEYHVVLRVTDALGRSDESVGVVLVREGRAYTVNLATEHPSWVDSAVLYGAAPYMFEPQGFAGIESRLDEIAKLGATAIWISPVTAAAPDDFGYAVVDQFAIRPGFGGAEGLRSLVRSAHGRGLRVLVDFVPNHFSQFHAYYEHAENNGKRSPYYDWFDRDASGKVTQYFDWEHLKNLNFDHPGVRNHITAAAARFIDTFEVDGFRIDASWAVAQRAPEFWPALRRELKRIDPDIVLLAEASAREPYHVSNGFDAAYDWTDALGEWAWRDVFGDRGVDLDRLRTALTNDGRGYPADSLILRFINNNDTGDRFITRHGVETTRLAATLLFTLPGIPLIYNGDEIGAAFQPYDEGPPIRWQPNALTEHYRQLAHLRRELEALQTREIELLQTTATSTTLAYLRPSARGDSDVIVIFNFASTERVIAPSTPRTRSAFLRLHGAVDALTGERVEVSTTQPRLKIPALTARVLRLSRSR